MSSGIPTLSPQSVIRSSDLLLDCVGTKINDLLIHAQAMHGAMFRSFASPSYMPSSQAVGSSSATAKVFQQILQIADEVALPTDEKALLQYHIIGGRSYILMGNAHMSMEYLKLLDKVAKLARAKKLALFWENMCSDAQTERDYTACMSSRQIFGVEGSDCALAMACDLFLKCSGAKRAVTQPRELKDTGFALNSDFRVLDTHYTFFLMQLHFNATWDRVIPNARITDAQAQKLFREILDVMGTAGNLREKEINLYPKLFAYEPPVWANLFQGLIHTCLQLPSMRSCYSNQEVEVVQNLLKHPTDLYAQHAFYQFSRAHRDPHMAKAIFSKKLPEDRPRVVHCGYMHLTGIVRELHKLAAAAKKS